MLVDCNPKSSDLDCEFHIVTTNTWYQRSIFIHFHTCFTHSIAPPKKEYQHPSKVKVNSIRVHYC
jgi:hypothetical protein